MSANFTLQELQITSHTDIDNRIPAHLLPNAERLIAALERVRELGGDLPIKITSGYRCPELNKRVGGSSTGAHPLALAADMDAPAAVGNQELFRRIVASDIQYDQVIAEFFDGTAQGGWIHLGLAQAHKAPRRQALRARRVNGKIVYEDWTG